MATLIKPIDKMSGLSDLRLMQLISPTLPIGAFTYSQGLEWAIENGLLGSPDSVYEWLSGLIEENLTYLDLPVLAQLYSAYSENNSEGFLFWSEYLLASRETSELRQEELNRARALSSLLTDLQLPFSEDYKEIIKLSQLSGFALAAVIWQIPLHQSALGYAWSWVENQVAAAIKLVPIGQTDGQRLQMKLAELLPAAVEKAILLNPKDIGASASSMAIASSLHETQYTRLFRS